MTKTNTNIDNLASPDELKPPTYDKKIHGHFNNLQPLTKPLKKYSPLTHRNLLDFFLAINHYNVKGFSFFQNLPMKCFFKEHLLF